jgi:propanol-preferring alcohol dehydrogenase
MTKIMKALRIIAPQSINLNPLRIESAEIPAPYENEILIRINMCGICHTDLHVIEGELPQLKKPLIPGHQVVGIVEKIGWDVSMHKLGDRVGVAWLYSACGSCEFCLRGEENLCTSAYFTGYSADGGYAEYMTVQESYAYKIPEMYSDENAAPLLCAGIIGFRSLRLCGIKNKGRLGLIGFGASAHLAIQVARHWECEVFVFSRSQQHRKLAEQLGAVWTGTLENIPPHPLDSIISFAPVGDIVPNALRALRRGGTLALAGVYMTSIPAIDYSYLYNERIIRSVANSTRKDANDFLRIAAEIPIIPEVEVFPLADANWALQLLKESKIRGAGVLKVF